MNSIEVKISKAIRDLNPLIDEERTSIRPETTHILWIIYAFAGTVSLQDAMDYACDLLKLHAGTSNGTIVQYFL
jgi:hypothetical protein